jgi:multisubunit Na+/H+ antiporter MnhB subunit
MSVLAILVLLMIVGALIAIETTNLLSSIVCLGAVGFLLSIAFLFLGAPDIAVTQLVVEILALVILIRAAIRRNVVAASGDREFFGLTVTVALVLAIAALWVQVPSDFPELGVPVMQRLPGSAGLPAAPSTRYIEAALRETGAANVVTAILLDYRAYDTLGEATVLFCSILGALALLRKKARKRADEPDTEVHEP